MTRYRLVAVAFRCSITAAFAFWVFAPGVLAQPVQADKVTSITGVYNGTYAGEQGPTKFKLSVTEQDTAILDGKITLYLPDGSNTKAYTCNVDGLYTPARRIVDLDLIPSTWESPLPNGINMTKMTGLFDPDGSNGAGQISGKMWAPRPGPKFEAIRDAAESAKWAAKKTSPTAINGVYTGEFKNGGAPMKLKLSIKSTDDGSLTGLFTFNPPHPPAPKGSSVTYKLTGKYVAGASDYGYASTPFQFTTIEPMGSLARDTLDASKAKEVHVGITSDGSLIGLLTGLGVNTRAGQLNATKDRTESADLDKVMLAQASAASTTAPAVPVVRRSYEGVYNGTYASKQGPPTKFKLTLWMQQENRTAAGELVNTDVAGLFTLYLSEGSGTKAYTCELKGSGGEAGFQLIEPHPKWDAAPPGDLYFMKGLSGKFDPNGSNGARQISGSMMDTSDSKFQAIRDTAESANMDLLRLRNNIRPGIEGVFNGTYTREKGPPTKVKLTMTHTRHGALVGLAGMATIYLPVDSGTKAYTYSLTGVEVGRATAADVGTGEFELRVNDWETMPLKDYDIYRSMGFNGKLVVNLAQNTARIVSAPVPTKSEARDFVPKFEATWDATESADIDGTITAQKAVDAAEYAAALKARDETVRNALPKQLASKDLVRKSKAYWDAYQTDMIREVFDGGFGAAIDENQLFQLLFCTYVEMYSAKYAALLPADHQTVTITRYSTKPDGNGGYIKVADSSSTVEVDSRLAPKYRQFAEGSGSSGGGMGLALAAMASGASPRAMVNALLAPLHDMQRFFANHDGKSAAMRQLTENFLRGATGEPSLQQVDGKIDGAQAETDKDLPPGRYARLVDAANAFDRERAKADPGNTFHSSSHDTAFCQRLAEQEQAVMSREEEYYYANDFAGRFNQIMAKRGNCTDPAWPRLHPAYEKAIE